MCGQSQFIQLGITDTADAPCPNMFDKLRLSRCITTQLRPDTGPFTEISILGISNRFVPPPIRRTNKRQSRRQPFVLAEHRSCE